MRNKPITVAKLAKDAGLDVEEVLLTLWEKGFQDLMTPDSVIPAKNVKAIHRDIGLATRNEIKSLSYWASKLGITVEAVRGILGDYGLSVSDKASMVPQGGVSKLMAESRKQGIGPLTDLEKDTAPEVPQDAIEKQIINRRAIIEKYPPIIWDPPGHRSDNIRWLNEKEIKRIHYAVVRDFAKANDPIVPCGVRSEHLLSSALFRPQTNLGENMKYSTVESATAALLHSIIQDHPFHNGNKRTALVAMLVSLDENGIFPTFGQDEVFKLVLQIAQHRIVDYRAPDLADREVLAISKWICDKSRLIEKGEKQIPWRKMKQILRSYDCDMSYPKVGNRINIERTIITKGIFGREKKQVLRTQVYYGDDGRDVEVDTIKKIRSDLYLNDLNGIDSHDFYAKEPLRAEDFIARYRKTLKQLSRL